MAAVKIQHKNCLQSTLRKKIINTLFASLGRSVPKTSRPANNIYHPRARSLRTLTGKSNGRRSGVDCSQEGLSKVEVIQVFFSLRLQYFRVFPKPF